MLPGGHHFYITFKTKAGRKYWRMQEMDNPCEAVTDYVDIYFRGI